MNSIAGITQRPPSYAQLLIDSMDRYKFGVPASEPITDINGDVTQSPYIIPTTSANWKIALANYSLQGYFSRLAATQINFQYNLPTIIQGYNNLLQIFVDDGAGDYNEFDVTLTTGFYTPAQLATEVQTELNAQIGGGVWTCVFLTAEGVFEISGPDAFYFKQPSFNGSPASLNSQRCRETLGFLNLMGPVDSPATTLTGSVPTMLPTKFIDIVSSYLTKYQNVKDNTSLPNERVSNVIARVYPQAPNTMSAISQNFSIGSTPFNLLIDYNTPKFINWSEKEAIGSFDLQLVDDYGNQLPFKDSVGRIINCEYQITLFATEA